MRSLWPLILACIPTLAWASDPISIDIFGFQNGRYIPAAPCQRPAPPPRQEPAATCGGELGELCHLLTLAEEIPQPYRRASYLWSLGTAFRNQGNGALADQTEDAARSLVSTDRAMPPRPPTGAHLDALMTYSAELAQRCKTDEARDVLWRAYDDQPADTGGKTMVAKAKIIYAQARLGDTEAVGGHLGDLTTWLDGQTEPPQPPNPMTAARPFAVMEPPPIQVRRILSMTLAELGEFDQALELAAKDEPWRSPDILIAQVVALRGQLDRAVEILRRIPAPPWTVNATRVGEVRSARESIILALLAEGRLSDAQALVDDLGEWSVPIVSAVAKVMAANDLGAAMAYFKARKPGFTPVDLIEQAAEEGNPDTALKFLDMELSTPLRNGGMAPYGWARPLASTAFSFARQGRLAEAVALLDRGAAAFDAVDEHPYLGYPTATVAMAYAAIGQPETGIALLRRHGARLTAARFDDRKRQIWNSKLEDLEHQVKARWLFSLGRQGRGAEALANIREAPTASARASYLEALAAGTACWRASGQDDRCRERPYLPPPAAVTIRPPG